MEPAISRLLRAIRDGVAGAAEQLYTVLLRQLRRLSEERKAPGMRTADLIREAYWELVREEERSEAAWQVFWPVAVRSMRRIIVEETGGIELDRALERLFALDERQARVVEMHVFGGFTETEMAQILGTTERTIRRDLAIGRTWLFREIGGSWDSGAGLGV